MAFDDYKNFFVFGMARSGRAIAALLAAHGRGVVVYDENTAALESYLTDATGDVAAATAADWFDRIGGCDCLVVSPGVPLDHRVVARAHEAGIPVIGEIEAAFHFTDARIVGVTGTNGKSTVVGVIGEILSRGGYDVDVAGNIGRPLAESVLEAPHSVLVLELSSFQLDTIDEFGVDVAILLNVTPDHLDRYNDSFDEYVASKGRILNRADGTTVYVYNADDVSAATFAETNPGRSIPFSSSREVRGGVFERQGAIVRNTGGVDEHVLRCSEFTPVGVHNLENAMAAVAAATAFDVSITQIREALLAYRPLPHRMELVRVIGGVAYVNDSKATNVDAAIKSLRSVEGNAIIILGGRDKNGDFEAMVPHMDRVLLAVLIGEAAGVIRAAIAGHCRVVDAEDMAGAVAAATTVASAGDTVLLAPACASFDMFTNYQLRGEAFREAVNSL